MIETEPAQITVAPQPGLVRRIIAFPLTLMLVGGAVLVAALSATSYLLRSLDPPRNSPWEALAGLAMAAVVVLVYKAYKRWIERAPDTEFTLAGAPRELGLGLAAGFLLFSGMAGIVALLGGLEVQGVRGTGQLWSMLLLAFVSGTFEEALFRGLIQRHMETMVGTWGALAFTSGLFGLAHIFNPDATVWSSLAIALEAGILLGAAWLLTRRLWLAVGIHAAWNFTQGWVFSIPVSGGESPLGLLITRRVGPDWLTGGDFGLEASVVAMIVATLAGLLMLRRAVQRHSTVPPMWRRRRSGQLPG